MAFEHTLRSVQAARAAATVFGCISIVFFAYVIRLRADASAKFLAELKSIHSELVDIGEPSHGTWGGIALLGLALSTAWNGFCFFDLMIKKHYRFDRRVCIFLDIVIAIILAITGFLNFAYDAIIYFALELATGTQVRLEVTAIVFLVLATLSHFAFFCYGCRDPAAAAMNFEHVPLDSAAAMMPHHDYEAQLGRSRSNTNDHDHDDGDELVEIDLGKKVQIIKLHPKDVDQKDVNMRTPPRTPREDDKKRLGFVGAPAQIATLKDVSSEESPFLHAHNTSEWI